MKIISQELETIKLNNSSHDAPYPTRDSSCCWTWRNTHTGLLEKELWWKLQFVQQNCCTNQQRSIPLSYPTIVKSPRNSMQNMTKTQGKDRLTPPTWLDIRQITNGTWKEWLKPLRFHLSMGIKLKFCDKSISDVHLSTPLTIINNFK